jgi:hypothetical protein
MGSRHHLQDILMPSCETTIGGVSLLKRFQDAGMWDWGLLHKHCKSRRNWAFVPSSTRLNEDFER